MSRNRPSSISGVGHLTLLSVQHSIARKLRSTSATLQLMKEGQGRHLGLHRPSITFYRSSQWCRASVRDTVTLASETGREEDCFIEIVPFDSQRVKLFSSVDGHERQGVVCAKRRRGLGRGAVERDSRRGSQNESSGWLNHLSRLQLIRAFALLGEGCRAVVSLGPSEANGCVT